MRRAEVHPESARRPTYRHRIASGQLPGRHTAGRLTGESEHRDVHAPRIDRVDDVVAPTAAQVHVDLGGLETEPHRLLIDGAPTDIDAPALLGYGWLSCRLGSRRAEHVLSSCYV